MLERKKYKLIIQAWILAGLISNVFCWIEFCTKSGTDPILFLSEDICPYGALFPHPVTVDCIASSEGESIISDVCTNEAAPSGGEGPFQVQLFPPAMTAPPDPSTTCAALKQCGKDGYVANTWIRNIKNPQIPRAIPPWPETDDNPDKIVTEQTDRLFRHMIGLSVDDLAAEPNFRIITLLKKSFEIASKYCGNNRFFPREFTDDVLTAFMFLLGESDISKIIDIPLEEFRIIDDALNNCLDHKNPFSIQGNLCETKPEIEFINTTIHTIEDNPLTEFSWAPEKYDIPVDVTWATMDFVHGMCYGYFVDHVNSHHLFEQAVEKLFTPEIVYRWDKPTLLGLQNHWDNFFSANVRTTIYNLEYCIAAAYDNAPFLHRLERMLVKNANADSAAADPGKKRKKRSVMQMPQIKDSKFFCFDTADNRETIVNKWKAATCPNQDASTP